MHIKYGAIFKNVNNADNICFGVEIHDFVSLEQIPDEGNKTRNKSLGLKRKLQ